MFQLSVIFVEPENPENVGSIARVMKNFGFYNLILVNPKEEALTEKAYIVSKHAKDILENVEIVKSFEEILKRFDLNIGTTGKISNVSDVFRNPITPEELKEKISNIEGRIGLYIGRESIGFTNEELKKFDIIVTIPTDPEYPIMNASHACAILLYEISKVVRENTVREKYPLMNAKLKRTLYEMIDSITEKWPLQDYRKPRLNRVLKNVIAKSTLTIREASILAGFFQKIIKILNHCEECIKEIEELEK